MTGNRLINAGFVDGITAWTSSAGTAPFIDESVYGFEGRLVHKASKVVADAEVVQTAVSDANGVVVVAGQTLEVFAHHAFTRGTTVLHVNFYTGAGGALVISVPVPLSSTGDGDPRLGLSKSFNFSHGRLVVPATATRARLTLYGTATSAGASDLLLMKPYLEPLPSASTKYRCWDPGPSVNEDLNLPTWPAEIPHLRADNFGIEPIPTHRGFATDSGVEITQRLVNVPWYRAQGGFRVTQELHAIFDKFFRENKEFWFVRPDTLQLCQATWLSNGDPVYSGLGSDRMVSFGLQIRVI